MGLVSRREFIRTTGSGLLIPTLVDIVESQPTRITFDQAKRGSDRLKQRYIDQLVAEMYGDEAFKYIDSFIYDPDSSHLTKKHFELNQSAIGNAKYHDFVRVLLNSSQELIARAIDHYSKDPRFADYDNAELLRTTKILEFLNTKEGIKDYAVILSTENIRISEDNLAGTLNSSYEYGVGKRSTTFLRRIFEDASLSIKNVEVSLSSSEEWIKSLIRHEHEHAKNNYLGIDLGNGMRLDNTTYHAIDPDVRELITEGEAYSQADKGQISTSDNTLERYNPGYLFALNNFSEIWERANLQLQRRTLGEQSYAFYVRQTERLVPFAKEAGSVLAEALPYALKANRVIKNDK